MTTRLLPLLPLVSALALVTLAVVGSASALPPAPPDPACSPGPASCGAWHTANVNVSWSAPPPGVTATGCGSVVTEDGGTPTSCTWSDAEGSRTTTVYVRRDASPPNVTASVDRGPDANGWYNRGVKVEVSGDDPHSGIASCSSGSYSGPDAAGAAVSGSCTNGAGLSRGRSVQINYDATPPSVETKPDRQPDANGWYNHAVTIAFLGTDPVSGVDACAAPVLYQGPDAPKTSLSGTCRDKAANTSPPAAFELKYDTKPPTLGRVRVEIASKGVTLRWKASKDSLSFAVVRRPGLRGKKPSTVYQGRSQAFIDRRLKAGIKYRYTVTAYDQAGNAAAKVLQAQPSHSVNEPARTKPAETKPAATKPALARPAQGARVAKPPLLTWGAVPEATYYNVQLYRAGTKILTVWVRHPKFRLQASWKYGGRTFRLSPGRYRWYVWPGVGPPSANRYGKLLGTRRFVLIRP